MDLRSIAEQVFEDLSLSECTTDTETACTESPRSSVLSLYFHITSTEDGSLFELFKQTLDWFDPDSDFFVSCKSKGSRRIHDKPHQSTLDIQSLALVLCLKENGHLQQAQQFFSCRPWKFHHKEWIGTQSHGYSDCQEYYTLTMDRPLCSVRKISSGLEHLQVLRYVSSKHWKDTINLYKLILSTDSPIIKRDMCVFTIAQYSGYEIQFCLKKLPKGILPKKTRKAELCFQVSDIGSLVPLFPNVCHKVSDIRWCTKDLDGNRIYLQVPKTPCRCASTSIYGYPKKSAFSPVVPNKIKSPDAFQDKFSPRVYQCNGSVKGRPPLPSKSVKEDKRDGRKKVLPSTTRNRQLSANSIPVSEVTNIRACTSQNIVRSRPSSANSVLISTAQCFHSHTDSGFVDSSMDSSYLKDPRRTPIIGTHLSNLTQYERFISTPTSSFAQYGELTSPTYSSDSVFNLTCQQHRKFSSLENLHSDYSKLWVEHYVADQNKILGLKRDYEININASQNYDESSDNDIHQSHENEDFLDYVKIESLQQSKNETVPATIPDLPNEITEVCKTDDTTSLNSVGSVEVTPHAVSVEDHNLDEYINLVWSSQNKNVPCDTKCIPDTKSIYCESNAIPSKSSQLISNEFIHKENIPKYIPLQPNKTNKYDESNSPDKSTTENTFNCNNQQSHLLVETSQCNANVLKSSTSATHMQIPTEGSLHSQQSTPNKLCPPPLLPKPMIKKCITVTENINKQELENKPLSSTIKPCTSQFTNQSSEKANIQRIHSDSSLLNTTKQPSEYNDYNRKSSFDLGDATKQFEAIHNGYDSEMPIEVFVQPNTNNNDNMQNTMQNTSTNIIERDENPITLGEFFDSNKMVSKFLEKRTVAQLPDVVQIQEPTAKPYLTGLNVCENSNDMAYKWDNPVSQSSTQNAAISQEAGTHAREGSPDDESYSDTNASDENKKGGRKRVTFSEVNSKHEYEAMDWNEDILPHDDISSLSEDTTIANNENIVLGIETYKQELSFDNKVEQIGNLSISGDIHKENTGDRQTTIKTDSAIAKVINKFNNHTVKQEDFGRGKTDNRSSRLDSSYSEEDWDNIKQKPQLGFYI